MWLLADVACRLGPRALAYYGWHRLQRAAGLPQQALRDRPPLSAELLPTGLLPSGPLPPTPARPRAPARLLAPDGLLGPGALPPPPVLPPEAELRLRAALEALPGAVSHGPFPADAPALALDLFRPGDVRPVWEANRLACLPLLVQAARLWPEEGHRARLESRLADWAAANPPFRGPNWACGQEAALRVLHMALALMLAGQRRPGPAARGLLLLHARRIQATRAYARAQDNNHSISEPAGLLACGWLLEDGAMARRAARALAAATARLVAPDGGFAQLSTGYHRLLLDVLSVVEALRLYLGAPPLPAPFAGRAAAAARWLARLVSARGALPALGHQDGSVFADLAAGGADDARGSVERAMRLFAGGSAGFAGEPGCRWLGLPEGMPVAARPAAWEAAGSRGWAVAGARGLLRAGPLRFRPGQADLLHFELWDGDRPLLTDAGTGAYNPPPGHEWWLDYFPSAAAHNTITFDEREPMPRLSRFLLARWPRMHALPDGAALRDGWGNAHQRRVRAEGRAWTVLDTVGGPFHGLTLRWRLGPGKWRLRPGGVDGPVRLRVTADAPLRITLEKGWESPAYGVVRSCPVLTVRALAPATCLATQIQLD